MFFDASRLAGLCTGWLLMLLRMLIPGVVMATLQVARRHSSD